MSVKRIRVTWRDGAYYVSEPNWRGGEVVPASDFAALEAELAAMTELRNLAVADLFPVCEERDALRAALADIATFGKKNPGYGYSCAEKAEAALAHKEVT